MVILWLNRLLQCQQILILYNCLQLIILAMYNGLLKAVKLNAEQTK